jgi:hypothetical protein
VVLLIKVAALAALIVLLFGLFRLAMALRWAKAERERERREEEALGRQVIAEIPLSGEDLVFLVEDRESFRWGTETVRKSEIAGARLLLNGGVLGEAVAAGESLPAPGLAEEGFGRERWAVTFHLRDGGNKTLHCGSLREGVSQDIAKTAFAAVKAAVAGAPENGATSPP